MTTITHRSARSPGPTTSAPWWYEIGRVDPLHPAVRATNPAVRALAVLTIVIASLGGAFAWHSDQEYGASVSSARIALVQAQGEQSAARDQLSALVVEVQSELGSVGSQVDRPAVIPTTTTALAAASAVLAERPDTTLVRSVTLPVLRSGTAAAQAHRDRVVEASQTLQAQLQSLRVSHGAWTQAHTPSPVSSGAAAAGPAVAPAG